MATQYVDIEGAKLIINKVNEKAPIDSPDLTGTPTVPTADPGTKTTQIASTEFVMNAIEKSAGSGVYTPIDSVPTANDLPVNPKEGDIYQVDSDTLVDDQGNLHPVSGVVDAYEDLPDTPTTGDVYKVTSETQLDTDNDGTVDVTYPENSYFEWDGTEWKPISGTEYSGGTDYKYTDGKWEPIDGAIDMSEYETEPIPIPVLEALFD